MSDQNNTKQLVTIGEERTTAVRLYGDNEAIAAFGYAVKKVAPWAKTMKDHDIGLIVRRALALGLDPLNPHEVQIWADRKGNVQFQLAYTLMAEWVRHFHGHHTEPQFNELDEAAKDAEGLSHEAMAFRVSFIMDEDIPKLQVLMDAQFPPEMARQMVMVTGLGVAFPSELSSQYFAPKGRSPAWKVKKRALTDAYRKKFGTPTRDQIIELRRISGRDQIEPDDWVAAGYAPAGVVEQTAQLEATARAAKETVAKATEEERQNLVKHHKNVLRGDTELETSQKQEQTDDDREQEEADFRLDAIPAIKDKYAEGNSYRAVAIVNMYIEEGHPLDIGELCEWTHVYRAARDSGSEKDEAKAAATKELVTAGSEALPF